MCGGSAVQSGMLNTYIPKCRQQEKIMVSQKNIKMNFGLYHKITFSFMNYLGLTS